MEFNKRYKAVAEHFTFYMLKNGYLNPNYEVDKQRMKNIFLQEYAAENHLQFKSYMLLPVLSRYKFLKKKKGESQIVSFRSDKVQQLDKNGSSPQLDESLTKPFVKVYVDQHNVYHRKIKKSSGINSTACDVCRVTFADSEAHARHLLSESHILKKMYRFKEFKKGNVSVTVEGEQRGILEIRPGIQSVIDLKLKNTAKTDCELTKIIPLNELPEVKLQKPNIPFLLKPGASCKIPLNYTFRISGAYHYVVVIRAVLASNVTYTLKEVVFQVQSELMDSLKPVSQYKRKMKAVIKHSEAPIISGEPLPPVRSQLEYRRRLSRFELGATLNRLLNNGLNNFKNMKTADVKKLKEVRSLLQLDSENVDVKNLLNAKNYNQIFHLLLYIEEHQMNRDIRFYDHDDVAMDYVPENKKLLSLKDQRLAENRPSILKGDKVYVQIQGDSSVQYEGVVHHVRENEVWLGFHQKLRSKYVEKMKFHVEYSFNRLALQLQHRALELAQQHHITPVLFPANELVKSVPTAVIDNWYNYNIRNNEEQKQAVCNIVAGSSYPAPYLIFGPPGTGKTLTLVEAITQLYYLKNKKTRILICAPSNAAADEIAKRLAHSGQGCIPESSLFRIYATSYNSDSIPPELKKCCNYDLKYKEFYYPQLSKIMQYPIVITTLVTAGRLVSADPPVGHFSHLFIDESGHALEPETLIPLAGLFGTHKHRGKIFGHIILTGDPKQLGPVLRSSMAGELGLGKSLLERLMTQCSLYKRDEETKKYNSAVLVKLVKNFRSHEKIITVPNELFYDGELQASGDLLVNLACNWERLPRKDFPVIFHGIVGNNEREQNSPSFFNRQEIDVVLNYINDLLTDRLNGRKLTGKDIGVVTPYRKQVEKFRKVFEKKKWKDITVGSVEEFQGQERLIIFISTVRSRAELLEDDYKFHLGFLNNPKRFNVAITRAKALLIVVGNPYILQCDANWRRFIEFCRDNKVYKGCQFTPTAEPPIVEKTFDLSSLRIAIDGIQVEEPEWRREQ